MADPVKGCFLNLDLCLKGSSALKDWALAREDVAVFVRIPHLCSSLIIWAYSKVK